jgi:hypothetical protein
MDPFNDKKFYGDDVRWFIGVVEDNDDPEQLGRIRVRIFGIHSPYYEDIAVEDLPWSTVLMPATEGGISGTGRSPNGIQQGAYVFGLFLDGKQSQNPLILGSMAKFETEDFENIVPQKHR